MPEIEPIVGIIMGSDSDLDIMSPAATVLEEFGVPYELRFISAHRTAQKMYEYATTAQERGLKVIIAGAGGSAHLPGMTASLTVLPVIGVPVKRPEHDHQALWSMVDMPKGIPLATMPENGAIQAAQLAVRILSISDPELQARYTESQTQMKAGVIAKDDDAFKSGWQQFLKDKK